MIYSVSEESKEDEVGLNNTVELYFEGEGVTERYKLVTSIRGNSLRGLISTQSPIGKAIMGHKEKERVFVEMDNDNGYYVRIEKIENTKDDDKDKIRSY